FYLITRSALQLVMESAPRVSQWAIRRFEWLDHDRDGMITLDDVWSLRYDSGVTAEDLVMVHVVEKRIEQLGHVLINTGNSTIKPKPFFKLYGISREDLQTYPERMRRLYTRDFGSPPAERHEQ